MRLAHSAPVRHFASVAKVAIAAALLVLGTAAPAWAESASTEPVAPPAAPTVKRAKPFVSGAIGSQSYKALLGQLVITRDLEVPGAPSLALRVLPTPSSLGGGASASPVVVRPRVDGEGRYGLHIRASF